MAEVGGNKGIAVPKFKASVSEVQVNINIVLFHSSGRVSTERLLRIC